MRFISVVIVVGFCIGSFWNKSLLQSLVVLLKQLFCVETLELSNKVVEKEAPKDNFSTGDQVMPSMGLRPLSLTLKYESVFSIVVALAKY